MRAALKTLAVAAPSWLAGVIDVAEFAERYGPRVDGWTMLSSKTERERLAQVFGQDALALCRAAWSPGVPVWIREIEAVALLRQILVQTYTVRVDARGREVVSERDADNDVSRPAVPAWPPLTTPTPAGPPRVMTSSGAAARSILRLARKLLPQGVSRRIVAP